MATFKFGRTIDLHWNGYDIQGPAETVFSIPDQLYEEFDADIAPVEPTLVWIDTNEFLTLSNSVSVSQLNGTFPISVTTTTSGKNVAISSSTNPAGYTMVADGTGGVIFQAGSTGALTSVVGISPISSIVSGNTVSVSLNANYQTAGTYVTGVVGTSPITASGTTAITVGIDQTALSVADASTAATLRTYVKNSSGSTITKGQAVYVTGADGTNALIGLASASADPTSSKTLGIAANTMTNNAFGYVIENGQLSNIDTSAATAGSSVWLGATPGSLVFNTPPAEPNHAVYLGVVTKANVSTGEILVKVQNGYELDELHDVFVGGVSTALPLVYSSASSGWVAQALTSVGIAAGAIGSAQIAAGAVGSAQIAAGAVDSAALANNAVVAAKIAAAAVGTSAINSGAATTGQVLTADGAGAATFTTISASPVSYSAQSITLNTWSYNTRVLQPVTSSNVTSFPSIASDPTSAVVYRVNTESASKTITKIDAAANTVMLTISPTMNSSEVLRDIAWGNGKLCVTTTQGGFQRWLIIDPATGSTLASGNIYNAGSPGTTVPAKVDYDTETEDFNIIATSSYTVSPLDRPVVRFVNSNTYTTKVHDFTFGTLVQAGATVSVAFNNRAVGVPRWLASASRYVMMHRYPTSVTNGTGQLVFLSASTATSDHLTITGRQYMGTEPNTTGATGYANRIIFAPSQTAMFYPLGGSQASGVTQGMRKIVFSNISSSYNTVGTTISFTAHTDAAVTPTSNLQNYVLTNGAGTDTVSQSGQAVIGFTDYNGVFLVQLSWWALFDQWLYRYGDPASSGSFGSLFQGATYTTNTPLNLQTQSTTGDTTSISYSVHGGNTYIYYYRASSSPVEYVITGTKVGDSAKPYTIFPSSTNGGVANYIGTSVSTAVSAIRPQPTNAYAIVASAATATTAASYAVEPSTVLQVGITQSPATSALAGSLTLKSWSVK